MEFPRGLSRRRAPRPLGWRAGLVTAAAVAATLLPTPGQADVAALRADHSTGQGADHSTDQTTPGTKAYRAARLAARVDPTPLKVRIDSLTPGTLPRTGAIEVTGSVTNRTDETWTTINIYPFLGDDLAPMRNSAQLRAAMTTPVDAYVGERVVSVGTPGRIDALEPGQTASYELRVPVSAFNVTERGVYWFGVQALGTSPSGGRDQEDDGRARTFIPYIPRNNVAPVRGSIVVPLTRSVEYNDDGSLARLDQWRTSLSPGGRLHDLVAFADAAIDDTPVTWLVDPAVIDAVAQLADGNPPRPLEGTSGPTDSTTEPTEEPEADPNEADIDEETQGVALAALDWLDQFADAVDGGPVLALPYGNLDVSAAVRYEPSLYSAAQDQGSRTLRDLGISTEPAIASPSGYVDPDVLLATSQEDEPPTVFLTDDMFTGVRGPVPALTVVDDQPVVATSAGAAEGGPGPGKGHSTIGLRQRFLAEAAIRRMRPSRTPLVMMLPSDWDLVGANEFFTGLGETPWLDLDTLSTLTLSTSTSVAADAVTYPLEQRRRELDPPLLREAARLADTGALLQRLLVGNDQLGSVVARESLLGASYSSRGEQPAAIASMAASRGWLEGFLDGVHIRAAKGVTLSSTSGTFVATITNTLDYPITVGLSATSDEDITFTVPQPVELPPNGRTNMLVEAHTSSNKVHNVTLTVTDRAGNPTGASTVLPIRSAQVSQVIWLIMGTGVGLLFAAIVVRLVRRIRRHRAGGPADAPDPSDPPAPADDVASVGEGTEQPEESTA